MQQVQISLSSLDDLFGAPPFDPFVGHFETQTGMERLVAEVQPRRLLLPLETTILLPPEQVTEGLAARTRAAVQGYARARIREIDLELTRVHRQGMKELWLGILFLAVCLLVAGSVDAWDWGPDFLSHVVVEGVVIVGWIALWHPVDLLLFERWTLAHDRRVYRSISEAEVLVRGTA